MYWPLVGSSSKECPGHGEEGGFWEDRNDRRHCGTDLYAPAHTPVVAIGPGLVVGVEVFTSRELNSYWNITYVVTVKNDDGVIARYGEVVDVGVAVGKRVTAGEKLAVVGEVLDIKAIGPTSPSYIRRLKTEGRSCMLHLEVCNVMPQWPAPYSGGNLFQHEKPGWLKDPSHYLTCKTDGNSGSI